MEGLGSARSTEPECILRWVVPLASKRTPPARAAKQLVPARPSVFGFAILRRARIDPEQAVTGRQASSSMPNEGSAHRPEPATNHCGRAARTDADSNVVALARPSAAAAAWDVRAFECRPLKAR